MKVSATVQRHRPTSLARSCSMLRVGLSRGRREARSPHHGQSLTSRNTAKFFWMHCAASLRICRRRMWMYGVHPPGKEDKEDRRQRAKPWRERGHNLLSIPAHLQHGPAEGGPRHGELLQKYLVCVSWGMHSHACSPQIHNIRSAGRHNTVPSASYTPGETESPCKPLGREGYSGPLTSLVASPAWKPHLP